MSVAVAAPALTTVELLRFQPQSPRTSAAFEALMRASVMADVVVEQSTRYRGIASWLMLWGPGAPDRFEPMRQQLLHGGHVICWDLAYWHRATKLRVAIDAAHPQAWVMRRDWPISRFEADLIAVSDRWNPDGPVIVAGIGRKATVQYGSVVETWERQRIAECRSRWPTRPILYRHKREFGAIPEGTTAAPMGPIEEVLQDASLVITWHSNVAVDAIRMGIPVVCQDGAAAAVCPSTLTDAPQPLPLSLCDRFLSNLAWFQWGGQEGVQTWQFLKELLA